MKGIFALAMAGSLFLATNITTIHAQPISDTEGTSSEERFAKGRKGVLKELNLTKDQIEKVKSLKQSQSNIREMVKRLKEEREKFQDLIGKSDVTDSEIRAKATLLKSLFGQIIDTRIDQNGALKQILTTEQFNKFNTLIKEREENRRKIGAGKFGE